MSASEAATVVAAASVNVAFDETASSRVGQIAILTAVATAARAFGRVAFVGPEHTLLVRGECGATLHAALRRAGGANEYLAAPTIFVTTSMSYCRHDDLRVTLRRGVGGVAPADAAETFDVTGYAPAAILGASLAVSDMFRRCVLHEPDDGRSRTFDLLPNGYAGDVVNLDNALPPDIAFLGLGHLGQAALFASAMLGYVGDDRTYELFDDEGIDPDANFSTQLLLSPGQTGLKTAACELWLQARGIGAVVKHGRLGVGSPQSFRSTTFVAGFDNPEGRRALDLLSPAFVVDAGIGARIADFTAFRVHVFPQGRLPSETFHDAPAMLELALAVAREQRAFAASARSEEERCGMMDVAGVASGSPFAGTAVASIVLSELIRNAVGIARDDIVSGDLRRSDVADCYGCSSAVGWSS